HLDYFHIVTPPVAGVNGRHVGLVGRQRVGVAHSEVLCERGVYSLSVPLTLDGAVEVLHRRGPDIIEEPADQVAGLIVSGVLGLLGQTRCAEATLPGLPCARVSLIPKPRSKA